MGAEKSTSKSWQVEVDEKTGVETVTVTALLIFSRDHQGEVIDDDPNHPISLTVPAARVAVDGINITKTRAVGEPSTIIELANHANDVLDTAPDSLVNEIPTPIVVPGITPPVTTPNVA